MGTIAELLGFDLSEEGPDPESVSAGADAAREVIDGTERLADPVRDAVSAALSEEVTGVAGGPEVTESSSGEAAGFSAGLTLADDLDLDTLGRYAVVTTIERSLKISLRDEDVDAAQTVGDLVTLVRSAQSGKS